MLKLHQFIRSWGIPNQSHFCCKLETYLRMAGIKYEIETGIPSVSAPKGKFPYIEDGDTILGDSGFIVLYLKKKYHDLDKGLSEAELGVSLAMQRLLEEHFFWATMYSRWQYTDANWQALKQGAFLAVPLSIRDEAADNYRPVIQQQIYGHGMGRHTAEEIFALGNQDIDALSACLGDKKYFLGDRPTTLDACAFGFLINTIGVPIESPIKEHALSKNNLTNFVNRIKAEYYQDLQVA